MKRKRILIVDDHKNMRFLLSEEFLPECDVSCCENGIDALREFKKNKPDIVLTDFKMSQMNGDEFIEKIKEIDCNIPVIMFTGSIPFPKSKADKTLEKSPFFNELRVSINKFFNTPPLLVPA